MPPSAGWHVVPSAHISVDESSGLAEIHILSKELNTSRSHWLRVSTILSDSSRTLPSSKPIHFKTGRGSKFLGSRAESLCFIEPLEVRYNFRINNKGGDRGGRA